MISFLVLFFSSYIHAAEYKTTITGDENAFVYTTNDPTIHTFGAPKPLIPFSLICYLDEASDKYGKRVCVLVNEKTCLDVEKTISSNFPNGVSRLQALETMFANTYHSQSPEGQHYTENDAKETIVLKQLPTDYVAHYAKVALRFPKASKDILFTNTQLTSMPRYRELSAEQKAREVDLVRPKFFNLCKENFKLDLAKKYAELSVPRPRKVKNPK